MKSKIKNNVKNNVLMPLQVFMRQEKSGGIVLAISVIIALILANSPLAEWYTHFFEYKIEIGRAHV